MDGDMQARYVAVYRAKLQMDAVVAHDQAAEMKKQSRPGKYGKK